MNSKKLEDLPLSGKTILVTRASSQAGELTRLLQNAGATVLEVPAIEIEILQENRAAWEEALERIAEYSWLIFTSANTVEIVDRWLKETARDWAIFEPLKIGCIGAVTAQRVSEVGGRVALVPPHFRAESLAEQLTAQGLQGKKILLPRAAGSREILPVTLQQAGGIVHEIHLYRAALPDSSRSYLNEILGKVQPDFITFTSSSTVRNFLELSGQQVDVRKTRIACIGPITASTLTESGLPPAIEASEYTIPGLVQAIIRYAENEKGGLA